MPLIDHTATPKSKAKKTANVQTSRVAKNGKFVTVKTVNSKSSTLSEDLQYVFTSNVRSVVRKK